MSLPPLPSSKSKFWEEAEKFMQEPNHKEDCKHYFERKSGKEIVCKNCHIGWQAGGKLKVKNGRLVV